MQINRTLRFGMFGEDIKEWQKVLISSGYDLSPFNVDGHFGNSTHNATISWQKERGLLGDGIVGPKTLTKITDKNSQSNDTDCELNITYLQAKNYTHIDRSKDIKWIVLHSMEAIEASTTAENVAKWFAGPSAPKASAHFNLDDDTIVQSVKEEFIAWHAKGGNRYGIGIEHAGFARQTREQWLDSFSTKMLKRSAKLSAYLCNKWNIPPEFVDREGLKQFNKGITTHNEITFAFRKGSHVDPGKNFPMDLYISWIKEELEKIK